MGIPILGICYGMQLIGHLLGGEVTHSEKREYGKAKLILDRNGKLIQRHWGKGEQLEVWMSHGDQIKSIASWISCHCPFEEHPFCCH